MPDVWMVVATGFYDDNRVRKAAASARAMASISSVHVIATETADTAAVRAASPNEQIDVRKVSRIPYPETRPPPAFPAPSCL